MARLRGAQGAAAIALVLGLAAAAAACFSPRKYPGPEPCQSVADCDDHSACTLDFCNDDGACDHTAASPPPAALDDGNPCTKDGCAATKEQHVQVPANTGCGNGPGLQCNAAGACVTCEVADQCGADTDCLKWACLGGACKGVPAALGSLCSAQDACDGQGRCVGCNDKTQNGGETDVDCGGPCAKRSPKLTCAVGLHCDADTDCTAPSHCRGGVCCTTNCSGSAP